MKCLKRMYHDQGRDVVFYENAAAPQRRRHAAMGVIPLPRGLAADAPAFFKVCSVLVFFWWFRSRRRSRLWLLSTLFVCWGQSSYLQMIHGLLPCHSLAFPFLAHLCSVLTICLATAHLLHPHRFNLSILANQHLTSTSFKPLPRRPFKLAIFYRPCLPILNTIRARQPPKAHQNLIYLPSLTPTQPQESILSQAASWSQHRPLIDTLARARSTENGGGSNGGGLGKLSFRRSIAKEAPYFHVWFDLDGGLGHVVEDEDRWPKGDVFARETLGGMLDAPLDVIRKQGRWTMGPATNERVERFRMAWQKWDWTGVLHG